MVGKISMEQYGELCESLMCDSYEDFHKMLKEITGITAMPYTAYHYFNEFGDYLGSSNGLTVSGLLDNAYIKIDNT